MVELLSQQNLRPGQLFTGHAELFDLLDLIATIDIATELTVKNFRGVTGFRFSDHDVHSL